MCVIYLARLKQIFFTLLLPKHLRSSKCKNSQIELDGFSADLCHTDLIVMLNDVLEVRAAISEPGLAVCDPCGLKVKRPSGSAAVVPAPPSLCPAFCGVPLVFEGPRSLLRLPRRTWRGDIEEQGETNSLIWAVVTERSIIEESRWKPDRVSCEPCGGISMFRPCWLRLLLPASWETKQTPTTSTSQLLNYFQVQQLQTGLHFY